MRLKHWLYNKLIFTCPTTDGGRFVLHLVPSFGLRGVLHNNVYQKCIMWDYYTWYPNDEDLMGYSKDGTFSVGIPFTKHELWP